MKNWKKIASLLLVGTMAVSMLAGCQSGTRTTEPEDGQAIENDEGSANNNDNSGEVPTFTIATVRYNDTWPIDFLESGMMAELEKKHNINIEWQVYYSTDWAEQKSLLLASGDLPDAFFGSICLDDNDITQNKADLVELTDLIDENMPNLTKIFEDDPELLARAKNSDGEIYSLVKRLPFRPKVLDTLFINKTWLDNLGLDMPETYKDLEEVLLAFKEQDADGDGDPNNEIPFSSVASLSEDLAHILSPFGTYVSRMGNYMGLNGDGKPVFMPVQENYKEAVVWAHELYEKGILDQERFTQDWSMLTGKLQAEGGAQVGIVYGWTKDAQVGANADDFVEVEALVGPYGERYAETDPTVYDISNREFVITSACEDPAALLRWADDFYTDEIALQSYFGSIPDCIAQNDDGTYEVLLPADGSSLDTSAWSNSMRDFGPKYMTEEGQSKVTLPSEQGDGVKLAADALNAKYTSTTKNTAMPVLTYSPEQMETLNAIKQDIYDYVESQHAHWVVDGGIEEEWDGYLKQLEAMGLNDYIRIQEEAFDSYLETISGK